jgi:hypothetical protein
VKNQVELSDARTDALEARFALRVSARLHEGAAQIPHDITERLRVARLRALEQLRAQPVPATVAAHTPAAAHQHGLVAAGAAGSASAPLWVTGAGSAPSPLDDDPLPWRWKLATVLPVLVLLAGLWAAQVWHQQAKVQATTEVDMALLTDELPPDAYADPGFAEFLRQDQPAPALPSPTDEPLQVDDLIQEAVELRARESAP